MLASCCIALSSQGAAQDITDPIRRSYIQTGQIGSGASNYVTGLYGPNEYRSYFVFDLAAISTPVTGATLVFDNLVDQGLFDPSLGYNPARTVNLTFYDYTGSIPSLIAGTGGLSAFNDLGTGVSFGGTIVTGSTLSFDVDLNAAALASINAAAGNPFVIGARLTGASGQTYLFGGPQPAPVLRLSSSVPEPSTWAMMLLGFGAINGAMRRKRAVTPRVSYNCA